MGMHLIDEMLKRWRDRRSRMAAAREMGLADPSERTRVLAEAGLTPDDFGRITQTPFSSRDLLSPAMRAVGIGPDAFARRHATWHRDMTRACMNCPARSRCRRDLATGDFARRYRHYCLNADDLGRAAGMDEGP